MPAYHSAYDKCCPGEMSYSYNDYFFPISNPNINLLRDVNIELLFKNCVRIENNALRSNIKRQATKFVVIDTVFKTHWYGLDTIYIAPVVMDYKMYGDNFPKMMSQDNFELQIINGAKIYFYPKRTALVPIKINVLR